ncbi:MAG: Flp pilus assembly complex ATPase component TadA [Anaerolineales bacterium]|nr:Flp pilus assembly complex ATPase component TadA [Anaerolineales bacterium]
MKHQITDDLDVLLSVLPVDVAKQIHKLNNNQDLLEVIMDLGRIPTARYVESEEVLLEREISHEDIDSVVQNLGDFDEDNRAGIERTLHRISAIRNRHGGVVGLTCRVGRAVYGTIDILEDFIDEGKSLLILGRPGVGKTTLLREAARILAEKKRVVIVDTSNEIGGDGDVAHPAVGRARRMQVATPTLQHEVMIEAVENHNPEVIVIDEIGRELEAAAARTIAERGVQLIGTAHGNSLENLMLNPTLSDLVGGIESVTLSDEEARRRGTQKTVLERRSPPTFDVLVEIQNRDTVAVHRDVGVAVDSLLRGYPLPPEIRSRGADGKIQIETTKEAPVPSGFNRSSQQGNLGPRRMGTGNGTSPGPTPYNTQRADAIPDFRSIEDMKSRDRLKAIRIFAYGVARNRLEEAAKTVGVPIQIMRDFKEAEVLVTLRTYYRKRQRVIVDAERRGMPVYVLRSNTVSQMEQFLSNLFNLTAVEHENGEIDEILNGTHHAIESVLNGERWVELPPAASYVRRLQHQMAREADLISHSYGKEPNRRVRIFRE